VHSLEPTEAADSGVHISVQKDRRQQCVQFSTNRQTADSNVYSLVLTESLQTEKCKVQYRQTDRQTAESNVYSSEPTERPQTANYNRSVPTDRQQTAKCAVENRETDRRQQCVQFSNKRQTADSKDYSSVETDRRQQCVQFSTERQTADSKE